MQTISVGLIGKNILASKSPLLHQSEAKAQGIKLNYTLHDFSILNKTADDLNSFLQSAKSQHSSGFNITHPYKQSIIPFLDELSTDAKLVGAVNTVVITDAKIIGHNTDFTGFQQAFNEELANTTINKVLLLGAGGAGSAIATAMLKMGVENLIIFDTDLKRAQSLVEKVNKLTSSNKARAMTKIDNEINSVDGIINTTPVGMSNHPGMPISTKLLRQDLWIADIIYFPIETEFLAEAKKLGCKTMNGGKMAVYQAANSFEIFTGLQANKERMLKFFIKSYQ